jgi:hypothetical protein
MTGPAIWPGNLKGLNVMESIKSNQDYHNILADMAVELACRMEDPRNVAQGIEAGEILAEMCDDSPLLVWNQDIQDILNFSDNADAIFLDGRPIYYDTMSEFLRAAAHMALYADCVEFCERAEVEL